MCTLKDQLNKSKFHISSTDFQGNSQRQKLTESSYIAMAIFSVFAISFVVRLEIQNNSLLLKINKKKSRRGEIVLVNTYCGFSLKDAVLREDDNFSTLGENIELN